MYTTEGGDVKCSLGCFLELPIGVITHLPIAAPPDPALAALLRFQDPYSDVRSGVVPQLGGHQNRCWRILVGQLQSR